MKPFPINKRVLQKQRAPFANDYRDFSVKMWDFGYLNPSKPIVSPHPKPAMYVNKNCEIKNFAWKGSEAGIYIGSRTDSPGALRAKQSVVEFVLDNCFCEDVGHSAVSVFANSKGVIRNCNFRGNYKLNPLIERGPGQVTLIYIHGAEVLIENCLFFNCLTPIVVKANSKVTIRNCGFAICKSAVGVDGYSNPRLGDEYFNGQQGCAEVEVIDCEYFKCDNLAFVAKYGKAKLDKRGPIKLDGGEVKWL